MKVSALQRCLPSGLRALTMTLPEMMRPVLRQRTVIPKVFLISRNFFPDTAQEFLCGSLGNSLLRSVESLAYSPLEQGSTRLKIMKIPCIFPLSREFGTWRRAVFLALRDGPLLPLPFGSRSVDGELVLDGYRTSRVEREDRLGGTGEVEPPGRRHRSIRPQ